MCFAVDGTACLSTFNCRIKLKKILQLKPICQFLVPFKFSAVAEYVTTGVVNRNMKLFVKTCSSVKS